MQDSNWVLNENKAHVLKSFFIYQHYNFVAVSPTTKLDRIIFVGKFINFNCIKEVKNDRSDPFPTSYIYESINEAFKKNPTLREFFSPASETFRILYPRILYHISEKKNLFCVLRLHFNSNTSKRIVGKYEDACTNKARQLLKTKCLSVKRKVRKILYAAYAFPRGSRIRENGKLCNIFGHKIVLSWNIVCRIG